MSPKELPNEVRRQLQQILIDHPVTFWQRARKFFTPLVGAFGLVTLFYGFEALLGQSSFAAHPLWMVGLGTFLLLLTGSFFSKL